MEMEAAGRAYLASSGLMRYEISAYARPRYTCQHNRNYWEFGDYLGIGAGAHGKITHLSTGHVERLWKLRTPFKYLQAENDFIGGEKSLTAEDLKLEFLMNALRLTDGVTADLFTARTGLAIASLQAAWIKLQQEELLITRNDRLQLTARGQLFLDEVLGRFL